MRERASELEWMCERAGIRGQQRRVLELLAVGMDAEGVAAELGMAVKTVAVHLHRARKKLLKKRDEYEERDFHRFVLTEGVPGHRPHNPRTPEYRKLPGGGGERVQLRAGPLVSVDDMMRCNT
jgi:hypothetical protein